MYYFGHLSLELHEIEKKMDRGAHVTSVLMNPPMHKGNKQARYKEDNGPLSEFVGYKISRKERSNEESCIIISVKSLLNG